jgi:hypothetical protein
MPTNPMPASDANDTPSSGVDSDDSRRFGTEGRLDREPEVALDPDDPGPFGLENSTADNAEPGGEQDSA